MVALRITGADLSGSSGDASRTYTITDSEFSSSNLQVFVSGTYAYGSGTDYSVSGLVITFITNIFDDQNIDILYTRTSESSSASSYATPLQLARFMGIEYKVPDLSTQSAARTKEEVGTGDSGTTTIFWLDYAYVLADSYTLYYGSAEATATALTETTHYVLDKDLGKITLTATGVTLIATNKIYAAYSYTNNGLTNTQLQDAINRASEQIDNLTNNHWADSTDTTPDWNQHLDEAQDGQGLYNNNYFNLQRFPIPNISTTTNGAITADDATITVVSTTGFPSSGYILIEDDKISYTGKTDTTFTGCTSVSAHDDAQTVKAYVIEISTTAAGGTPSWNVLEEGTEFEFDRKTGRIQVHDNVTFNSGTYVDIDSSAPKGVANRFRVSYLSGNSSIPNDITKATLMVASKDIMSMMVRKAHSTGLNDFNPALLQVDDAEIEKILNHYRNYQFAKI